LEYASEVIPKLFSGDSVSLTFTNESIYLKNNSLDPEVIVFLEKEKFNQQLWSVGKFTVILVIIGGIVYLIYRIKKNRKLKNQN
jgi:flagellar biosynthesis/type III secretory pathway M-ring protein FliF/YscJ